MDISTIIAAAPVVKKVWGWTPSSLRVPLVVAGVVFVAYKLLSSSDRATGEPTST